MQSFSHAFFDIEVEPADIVGEGWLVKILSVDGRRFSYELHGPLGPDAIEYMKSLLDAGVFGDLVIDRSGDGWTASEAPGFLKRHS